MPIAFEKKPRGHPTIWARNLSKSPVDFIPAKNIGSNAKTPLRTIDVGFRRIASRPAELRPQLLTDAKLRNNFRGYATLARLPSTGVQVQIVHDQFFEIQTNPDSFNLVVNLGEAFTGRILLIVITSSTNPSSSGGILTSILFDGVEPEEIITQDSNNCYLVAQDSGTHATLQFETDTGTGNCRVFVFNIRDAQLPVAFAFAEDNSDTVTIPTSDVSTLGAVISVANGPAWEEGTSAINWTGTPDNPTPLAAHADYDDGFFGAKSASWTQATLGTDVTVTASDSGLGEGSSSPNIDLVVIGFDNLGISGDTIQYEYSVFPLVEQGLTFNLEEEDLTPDFIVGNDIVFNPFTDDSSSDRILLFGFVTVFFSTSFNALSATLDGLPLTSIDLFAVGFSHGAWFYIQDPGDLPDQPELRLTWDADPAPDLFLSGVSVWSIRGFETGSPILDFAHTANATTDGSESVLIDAEENGAIFAITCGAGYTTTNAQTWTGVDDVTPQNGVIVYELGTYTPLADEVNRVVLSTDDAGIAPDDFPEKYVMAVSFSPAAPTPPEIIYGDLITGMTFSYALIPVTNPSNAPISPLTYTLTLFSVPDVVDTSLVNVEYSYTIFSLINPPGHWIEDGGLSLIWTEEPGDSQVWIEEAPSSNLWTEEEL